MDDLPNLSPQTMQDESHSLGVSIIRSQSKIDDLTNLLPQTTQDESDSLGVSITSEQSEMEDLPNLSPQTMQDESHSLDSFAGDKIKRKMQFCIYCNKSISALSRHLTVKHKDEEDIKQLLNLSKTDKKRREIIDRIRIKGYVKMNEGKDVIVRRGGSSYLKCPSCRALFSENSLHVHYSRCTGIRGPKNLKTITKNLEKIEKADKSVADKSVTMCDALRNIVLKNIRADDSLFSAILKDDDIIAYGNRQCLRNGPDVPKQKNYIRSQMKILAKIRLIMTRYDSNIRSIIDIFSPDKWDNLMLAISEHAHLEEDSIKKKSPNNVNLVGLLISNLAKDILCTLEEDNKRKPIKRWLERYSRLYGSTIKWQANKLAREKKWQNKKLLPLADDLLKFNNYLKNNVDQFSDELEQGFNMEAWEALNKNCQISLMTFNRKRVGEVMTLTVNDYNRKSSIREGTDIFKSLTPSEIMMSNNFYHVEVRGKGTRPVPLLISHKIARAIDLLIVNRTNAGVSANNNHLFAKPGMGFFDPNTVFSELAYACGANNPEDITGTALRKHIATMTQSLNLSDNDFKTLCGFLGHTRQTHLEHYRQPNDAVHAARLSRLLTALDSGTISQYRGMSLEEIDVATVEVGNTEEAQHSTSAAGVEDMGDGVRAGEGQPSTSAAGVEDIGDELNVEPQPSGTQNPPEHRTPPRTGSGADSDYEAPVLTPTPPRKHKRTYWTTPEKLAMKRHFSNHLKHGTLPKLPECEKVKRKESALRTRHVKVMKAWVYNQNLKRKRE